MAKIFQKIYIEISNLCNLQCTFCPEVERPKKIMDLVLFEKVVAQCAPLCEEVALHIMGEPLLHAKLPEFLNICEKYQLPVNLTTNGHLLNEVREVWLIHPVIRQINFSLQSFESNFKGQDITDYMNKIFEFTKNAFIKRPDLYINYRLWNLEDPKDESQYNQKVYEMIEREFSVQIPKLSDIRFRKSKNLTHKLYLHHDTRFEWPSIKSKEVKEKGFCHALSQHIGIHASGVVVPCCLDKEADAALGDLNSLPLIDILQSPLAQKMKAGFKNNKLVHPLCQRCTFIRRFDKTRKINNPQNLES